MTTVGVRKVKMKDDFYLTLPSHSSLAEFPDNTNNNFKIRLPKLIRLDDGDWKVALASISIPDPKNALPTWLREDLVLFTISCYYVEKNNTTNKIGFETNVKLPHIKQHVDLSVMTGHTFLRGLVEHMRKIIIETRLYPHWLTGSPTDAKVFHPEFIVGDNDIILDTSKIQFTEFGTGKTSFKNPGIWIHKTLAYEMGWFEDDLHESDPQFAIKLGPNLSIKLNGPEIPATDDIKSHFTSDGQDSGVTHSNRYWIIPRWGDGRLMDYIRLSLSVSWRFINLGFAFNNVFGPSTRSLFVYSDVGASNVLGNEVTDFIREVNYERKGNGSYYFEPTHMHYIPLRKALLDIIQIQVAEGSGSLVQFGQGVTTVTYHFKNERRLLPNPPEPQ